MSWIVWQRFSATNSIALPNRDGFPLELSMQAIQQHLLNVTRRHFFRECGVGVGKIALASLLTNVFTSRPAAASAQPVNPMAPRPPHFAPKAKRVIHLFMAGAPSHL